MKTKILSITLLLGLASSAATAQFNGLPVIGDLLGNGGLPALPVFDPLASLSGQSNIPVPIVSDILGSEITSQIISGGVPGIDLILGNPAVPMFTPIAGELLQAVSAADLLKMLADSAP